MRQVSIIGQARSLLLLWGSRRVVAGGVLQRGLGVRVLVEVLVRVLEEAQRA